MAKKSAVNRNEMVKRLVAQQADKALDHLIAVYGGLLSHIGAFLPALSS